MNIVLTILADCAAVFEGGRTAPANDSVKKFMASLPPDLPIRILRYSDTAMWHIGPEPVPAGEVEWIDLPPGGYLSSLAHAANLAGQSLEEKPGVRNVVLLVSDGALSDPEQIVQAVFAQWFDDAVLRAAVPLRKDADMAVLRMFAGDNVFDPSILTDPRSFLSAVGENIPAAVSAAQTVTLSCSIDLGSGDSFSISMSGSDIAAVQEEMHFALQRFGGGDAAVREKIGAYLRRVL